MSGPSSSCPRLGATPVDASETTFNVWAPEAATLRVFFPKDGRRERMERDERGYHSLTTSAPPGTLYHYQFEDERLRPDPASRAQPQGVHGPSMVVQTLPSPRRFDSPELSRHVLYELHTGVFTREGTFDAIVPRLDDLAALGVTAIELMPIAQFPGERNWGYDGVDLFAAHWSYGGPEGLVHLVDACHERNLGVVLDVVYNHLGPEGNYLAEFGPYFTDRYKTPWGQALNFDGAESDHVREFFIQNALFWTDTCGIDALRLDAVHAIMDHTARPFLEDLADRVHAAAERAGRRVLLIAESSDNDPRLVRAPDRGGLGLDGCWNDDFHHAVRCALTGERQSYYKPYGSVSQIAKCVRDRFVFAGEYSAGYRRRHGAPARDVPHARFVVCTQNHDQVGNRPFGDRLDATAGPDGALVAATIVLLSPFTPMLWMGEEYGETAPFAYFVSHTDKELIEAVRRGRRAEFPELHAGHEPPDPQSASTFLECKLRWEHRETEAGRTRLAFYRRLLALRREFDIPSLAGECEPHAWEDRACVALGYGSPPRLLIAANMGSASAAIPVPRFPWRVLVDTREHLRPVPESPENARLQDDPPRVDLPARTAVVLARTDHA